MRILFQGDSITDAGRDRSDPHHLGNGYPRFAAENLRAQFPRQDWEFLNFGVSGDRTWELEPRWDRECLSWQPDILSVLIGINDTWRYYDQQLLTTTAQYEENLGNLLTRVREHTSAVILLLEPFLLPVNPAWACWREDLNPKIDAARRVARALADAYLPLDGLLNAACVGHDPREFSDDGVHPNETGARMIGEMYAKLAAPYILKKQK